MSITALYCLSKPVGNAFVPLSDSGPLYMFRNHLSMQCISVYIADALPSLCLRNQVAARNFYAGFGRQPGIEVLLGL